MCYSYTQNGFTKCTKRKREQRRNEDRERRDVVWKPHIPTAPFFYMTFASRASSPFALITLAVTATAALINNSPCSSSCADIIRHGALIAATRAFIEIKVSLLSPGTVLPHSAVKDDRRRNSMRVLSPLTARLTMLTRRRNADHTSLAC